MTHDDVFLRDVLETPLDDAPRLIYADYLEDTGREDMAAFIRVQCELALTRCLLFKPDPGRCDCYHCTRLCRERELLAHRRAADWIPPPLLHFSPAFRRGFVGAVTLPADDFMKHAAALFAAAPVLEVTLAGKEPLHRTDTLDTWLWGSFTNWYDPPDEDLPHRIPEDLWHALRGLRGWSNHFPTREGALTALSAACVSWGREQAGLPALPLAPARVRVP